MLPKQMFARCCKVRSTPGSLAQQKRPIAGFAIGLRGSEIDSKLEGMRVELIPEFIQEEVPGC